MPGCLTSEAQPCSKGVNEPAVRGATLFREPPPNKRQKGIPNGDAPACEATSGYTGVCERMGLLAFWKNASPKRGSKLRLHTRLTPAFSSGLPRFFRSEAMGRTSGMGYLTAFSPSLTRLFGSKFVSCPFCMCRTPALAGDLPLPGRVHAGKSPFF